MIERYAVEDKRSDGFSDRSASMGDRVTLGRVATRMSGSRDSRPRDHVFTTQKTEPHLSSSRIPKRWNSTGLEIWVIVGIAMGPGPLPYLVLSPFLL